MLHEPNLTCNRSSHSQSTFAAEEDQSENGDHSDIETTHDTEIAMIYGLDASQRFAFDVRGMLLFLGIIGIVISFIAFTLNSSTDMMFNH